jgi:hypothetical protein
MKTRESGMPEEFVWTGFFDPSAVFQKLGLGKKGQNYFRKNCPLKRRPSRK